jgi:hypothetical protein
MSASRNRFMEAVENVCLGKSFTEAGIYKMSASINKNSPMLGPGPTCPYLFCHAPRAQRLHHTFLMGSFIELSAAPLVSRNHLHKHARSVATPLVATHQTTRITATPIAPWEPRHPFCVRACADR